MADYHSWLVTDQCFKVKDPKKFKSELEEIEIGNARERGYWGLCYMEEDGGLFWLGGYDASLIKQITGPDGNVASVDVAEIVKDHLERGETAVFKWIGQEKLRSVSGYVVVVRPYGVESMTLREAACAIEGNMDRLRQGVKEALSPSLRG